MLHASPTYLFIKKCGEFGVHNIKFTAATQGI